jgi:sugar phosphate isomerase/epimerase
MNRRQFLASPAALQAVPAAGPTRFQIACMTLPYSAYPLERALLGIRQAGYDFVAWGVNHRDAAGRTVPALAVDAPPAEAARLAQRCRGMGLEPVMMFSTVHLESADALDPHLRRIEQAAAARIPFLLTFGKTEPGQYENVIRNLKAMAPRAQGAGVMVVIKQHGGNSATGAACARILKETAEAAIRICYDAGNVLDYENQDPIADIKTCWRDIRAFAIKDHRNWPKDQDCGPGFGEIDHYRLLEPVMRTGLTIPLACENIFEPLAPRPMRAEGVDALARRAREYLDAVLRGLTAASTAGF